MIKFTTYNIQYGRGLDGRIDLGRIADTVSDSDVIALQEVERYFPRSGDIDQVAELAGKLGGYHWVYGAGVDIDADDMSDDGTVRHRRRQFGNMLLSRQPIITSRNHLLPKYASTGPLSIQRSALEGVISFGARKIRVYSVHLTHISACTRMRQLHELLRIDREAVVEGGPIAGDASVTDFDQEVNLADMPAESILMGDFNFTPDSEEYTAVAGPVSDYGGRIVNPTGLIDAWTHCGNSEMAGVTAERRGEGVRMDFCFVSYSLSDRIESCRIDSDAVGSDHKPFSVTFDL
ncbi:MAG: endonuclease/exonuclease/phosphatase family protein [Acidiferrobacterales bacterium]|nr:endonuclease/exonuclease/phosphatase family protein [Acidiferrobacterales bacterium]